MSGAVDPAQWSDDDELVSFTARRRLALEAALVRAFGGPPLTQRSLDWIHARSLELLKAELAEFHAGQIRRRRPTPEVAHT